MTWLLVLLLALATHRITRLLVRDELPLVKVPRDALAHWLDPRDNNGDPAEPSPLGGLGRAIAYLVECDWCMSVWVGGGLVWATTATVGLPYPWLVWPALSTITGLMAAGEAHAERRAQLDQLQMTEREAGLRRRGQGG